MRKFAVVLTFLFTLLHADNDYELGKGVQVASLPLYVGGYFSLDYKNIDDESRYRIDDIAVLGYGGYEKFSYLAELEFKEFYVETHNDTLDDVEHDRHLYLERVYIDYNLDENYIFKVGKFNSPIGFWNLLPINVLRETTSNPELTSLIFPKFTTGLSGSYSSYGDGEFKIDAILQNNENIDDDYNNYQQNKHYGLGISYELNDYTFKLNGGYFSEEYSGNLYYFLLCAKYESDKFQIMSEAGSQKSKSEFTTAHAGYIQGLYRFSEQHVGILRAESYDNKVKEESNKTLIVGYTYRPSYPVAVKSEYQFHSVSEYNQFLLSFSVLF